MKLKIDRAHLYDLLRYGFKYPSSINRTEDTEDTEFVRLDHTDTDLIADMMDSTYEG